MFKIKNSKVLVDKNKLPSIMYNNKNIPIFSVLQEVKPPTLSILDDTNTRYHMDGILTSYLNNVILNEAIYGISNLNVPPNLEFLSLLNMPQKDQLRLKGLENLMNIRR